MPSIITIGHLGGSHGVKGWIKVISNTEPKENILNYLPWQFYLNDHWVIASIKASRLLGNHVIVQLEDCHTPEDTRRYNGIKIGIHEDQLPKLPDGEYYWSQLIGLTVINSNGVSLGVVDRLFETGANDVLVVVGEKTHFIPYLSKRVIQKIDLITKQIIVDWEADF